MSCVRSLMKESSLIIGSGVFTLCTRRNLVEGGGLKEGGGCLVEGGGL